MLVRNGDRVTAAELPDDVATKAQAVLADMQAMADRHAIDIVVRPDDDADTGIVGAWWTPGWEDWRIVAVDVEATKPGTPAPRNYLIVEHGPRHTSPRTRHVIEHTPETI
jgi:hypothetical protein